MEYPNTAEGLFAQSSDSLKLTFKVNSQERPHQAMVVFESQDDHHDEIMIAASVKSSGKGRFELDFSASDPRFRYTTRSYTMTFLVGGPALDEPFKYKLGSIEVQGPQVNPATRPKRVEYKIRPEIYHQFRPDQKLINRVISGTFSGLWSKLGIKFEPLKSLASNPLDLVMAVVFFGSLVGIEFLYYSYWSHVTLFPTLQYLGAISLVTLASGKSVLSFIQKRRLQRSE
ncbi:hypothetical protein BGW38_006692 [Lunasporangiospora selenospora]|uniref:Ribophorin II n=1 Tax=Lunasporangiospora selenospora TaxID=979761 RepID=A0A9P6FLK2_9FUNG|nr:hypothetical protein BGW38_006692 [Lunasporangiospora selenospora]